MLELVQKNYQEWLDTIVKVDSIDKDRESKHKQLGRLMFELTQKYGGVNALRAFVEDYKEQTGKTISYSSLNNYRWIWSKTKDLDLPDDIPFYCYQWIARTQDPESWAAKIRQGWGAWEVVKAIKEEKRLTKPEKVKTITCPQCYHKFNL